MNHRQAKSVRAVKPTGGARRPGCIFIISAPSGAGKSTLRQALLKRFADLRFSVSYTSRPPRSGEQAGVDYHFISRREFERGIAKGRWAEWARVHGHYYGTALDFLERQLAGGRDVLLEIDVQGARQVLKRYPQSVTIFIMPPSLEALRRRLESRGTENAAAMAVRLNNAAREMAQRKFYRHIIINDRLEDAVAQLTALIDGYRSGRRPRAGEDAGPATVNTT